MEDLTGITGNSYVVVDLQKIKRNVEKIRAHIGENVKFLPVLKGATCGHGLEEIAEFLVSECQFDMLCVCLLYTSGNAPLYRVLRRANNDTGATAGAYRRCDNKPDAGLSGCREEVLRRTGVLAPCLLYTSRCV